MARVSANAVTRAFRVKFNDGTASLFKVVWSGSVNHERWEDGEASTIWHPIDTRRCHWTISGNIMRRVAAVIGGQEYWNDSISRVFDQGMGGEGSSFILTQLRSENCGDSAARFESDVNDMVNRVNGAIHGVVAADLQVVMDDMKRIPNVTEVNAQ